MYLYLCTVYSMWGMYLNRYKYIIANHMRKGEIMHAKNPSHHPLPHLNNPHTHPPTQPPSQATHSPTHPLFSRSPQHCSFPDHSTVFSAISNIYSFSLIAIDSHSLFSSASFLSSYHSVRLSFFYHRFCTHPFPYCNRFYHSSFSIVKEE